MSVVYSVSCISPIRYGDTQLGFEANPQIVKKPTFLFRPESTYSLCRCQRPTVIVSAKTCFVKPYHFFNFFNGFKATNAIKFDSAEISSVDEEEEEILIDFDFGDEEDEGSPWEGAIVYRRNPSASHMEYCTTLERLGLGKVSCQVSRSTAPAMGLRVTKDVKDYADGTPVLVSIDVTRKKHRLRLDGIIRTVLSLACYRCGEPAAESVFSNFSLLLTEEPVEEPEVINFGTFFGEEKMKSSAGTSDEEDDDDDASIDLEDRLHFPLEKKEIDISKHIRDMVHLEITLDAVCDPKCKGLCLNCGANLNTSVCKCSKQKINDVGYGPLGGLKKQMQRK